MLKCTDPAFHRLQEEKVDLADKVERLEAFVRRGRRGELTEEQVTHNELQLLEEQLHYMRGYLRVLNARIGQVES